MLGDSSELEKSYIVCSYTDMRKFIDGLCAVIEDQLKIDPSSSAFFLFCGRRRDRIKEMRRIISERIEKGWSSPDPEKQA